MAEDSRALGLLRQMDAGRWGALGKAWFKMNDLARVGFHSGDQDLFLYYKS